MPNKTIYVSDDDVPLYERAQEIAGGKLSAAISAALRRYVEVAEGLEEGYEDITVKVGPGVGRKVRFSGVLLVEWGRSTSTRVEMWRVYRSRTGKYVVHVERSKEWLKGGPEGEKELTGWRAFVGNFSSNQTWGYTQGTATFDVAESLDELKEMLPEELYELVVAVADQPAVEDLDI
jgi:EXLDI family protein